MPDALHRFDETAWLDETAELVRTGRLFEVDHPTLAEYLTDMAQRDRREVYSRLVVLLAHLLKWEFQPDMRSGSWQATILEQQRELKLLFESAVLRRHADTTFPDAFADARKQAAAETGLARDTFPVEPIWDLDSVMIDITER